MDGFGVQFREENRGFRFPLDIQCRRLWQLVEEGANPKLLLGSVGAKQPGGAGAVRCKVLVPAGVKLGIVLKTASFEQQPTKHHRLRRIEIIFATAWD